MRFLLLTALLTACGVKQPPIAPQERPTAVAPSPSNLDCSPTDENCDKRDPHYKPSATR